jgi:hypothetical protein
VAVGGAQGVTAGWAGGEEGTGPQGLGLRAAQWAGPRGGAEGAGPQGLGCLGRVSRMGLRVWGVGRAS